jgi:hypothetical protein
VEKPLKSINPMVSEPTIILGMCGACGGTIEDYRREYESMKELQGGEFGNSGSKALMDEVCNGIYVKSVRFLCFFPTIHI